MHRLIPPLRRWGWLALLTAVCLPAVWGLTTVPFFDSDDGILHLFRAPALAEAIRQGVIYPRLFPSFAFGYGQAVLSYYGPLSYYPVLLIHGLGADFASALKWVFALGAIASGWSAYALARRFAPPAVALAGATIYVYFPYHLLETYQRGALAEQLAWIVLPLILWLCTPNPAQAASLLKRGLLLAACLAALILTHNLTALMFLPVVPVYCWIVATAWSPRQRIAFVALAVAGGLALSMFYWLPALAQSRWLEVSSNLIGAFTPPLIPLDKLLQATPVFTYAVKERDPYLDQLMDWPSAILLCTAMLALGVRWRRRDAETVALAAYTGLALVSLFMTLELSAPLWDALRNPLAFLQFPWRFMTFTGLGLAMATVIGWRRHAWAALVMIPIVIGGSTLGLRTRPLADTASDTLAMWRFDARMEQIGTTWTAEYMPLWVWSDRAQIPKQSAAPKSTQAIAVPRLSLLEAGYTRRRFQVQSDMPSTLRLHQFYLPGWHVTLDGQPLAAYPSTELGLLSVDLPPSSGGLLEIDFGATPLEEASLFASGLGGLVWIVLTRNSRVYAIALASCAVLAGYALIAGSSQPAIHAVNARFEDVAELVAVRADPVTVHPGDSTWLMLIWQARRETRENLRAFVHLVEADSGRLIAQSDANPSSYSPTSQWRTGEIIEDTRIIQIPADASAGSLTIYAGLYRNPPLQNLPGMLNGQSQPDGRVAVGELHITGR